MPHVGALVATSVLGLTAGTTAAVVATAAIDIGISVGLSYLAKSLAPKPTGPEAPGFVGTLGLGGKVPRSFPIGPSPLAGSLVYAGTAPAANGEPNAWLCRVIALSDRPLGTSPACISEIYVDGEKVTWNPGGASGDRGIEIPEYTDSTGLQHLFVKIYAGNQVAADAFLVSSFSADAWPWTSDHIGTGIAYAIVWARTNDDELFQGVPEVEFVTANGAKTYDPRLDTTVGGSGSHRWNDETTWAFSNGNNAVAAYNIIRGFKFGSSWIYGGQTIGATQLPVSNWFAAMNACDLTVNKTGGTEPQFRGFGEVRYDVEPLDEIGEWLKGCNGRISDCGGIYRMHVGAAAASLFTITDSNIVVSEPDDFDMFPPLETTINAIDASFISPAHGWQEKPLRRREVSTDGTRGRRQVASVTYRVSSKSQAQRLAVAALKEEQKERRHVLTLPPEYLPYEPGDFFAWNSTLNGYIGKQFRIDGKDDATNGLQTFYVTEVDPADYNWTPATDEQVVPDGVLTISRPQPMPAVDFNAIAVQVPGAGGRLLPGVRLSWNAAVADARGVEWDIRLQAGSVKVYRSLTEGVEDGSIDIAANHNPLTAYKARLRYLPKIRNKPVGTWSGFINYTTQAAAISGVDIIDLSLTAAKIADNAITTAKIADAAVIAGKLAALAVGPTHIQALAINNTHVQTNAINTANIVAGAIDAARIATGAVGSNQIAAGAIIAGKIAAGAIQAADIAAGAIVAGKIAAGSIVATDIAAATITATQLAANSVTTTQLAADSVNAGKIAANAIQVAHIAAGAVTAAKIAALTITASEIAAGAITVLKLAANSVTANAIAAGAITATKIQADEIEVNHLKVNSVSMVKIIPASVNNLGRSWLPGTTNCTAGSNNTNLNNPTDFTLTSLTYDREAGFDIFLKWSISPVATLAGGNGFWELWITRNNVREKFLQRGGNASGSPGISELFPAGPLANEPEFNPVAPYTPTTGSAIYRLMMYVSGPGTGGDSLSFKEILLEMNQVKR